MLFLCLVGYFFGERNASGYYVARSLRQGNQDRLKKQAGPRCGWGIYELLPQILGSISTATREFLSTSR